MFRLEAAQQRWHAYNVHLFFIRVDSIQWWCDDGAEMICDKFLLLSSGDITWREILASWFVRTDPVEYRPLLREGKGKVDEISPRLIVSVINTNALLSVLSICSMLYYCTWFACIDGTVHTTAADRQIAYTTVIRQHNTESVRAERFHRGSWFLTFCGPLKIVMFLFFSRTVQETADAEC